MLNGLIKASSGGVVGLSVEEVAEGVVTELGGSSEGDEGSLPCRAYESGDGGREVEEWVEPSSCASGVAADSVGVHDAENAS